MIKMDKIMKNYLTTGIHCKGKRVTNTMAYRSICDY